MIRINYQSDFELRVTLKDLEGNTMAPPQHPWSLHIADSQGTCWRCGFDGTNYEDCTVEEDAIVCYVNNPGYVPGAMNVTFHDDAPDPNFADGVYNKVTPLDVDLFLWGGPSDYDGEIDVEAIVQVIAPYITSAEIREDGDLYLTFNCDNIWEQ